MKWQFIVGAVLLVAAYWGWMQYRARLTPDQVQALRAALAAGARIVDVRTPAEFSGGHIDGAINVPLGELQAKLKELGKKNKPILVYCRSGSRSAQAVGFLRQRGFTNVLDLKTMARWRKLQTSN